ncbi:tyrosine-type recombinase/integrase [Plantactinospora veratri]
MGAACPRLARRDHGSWYFQCSVRNVLGRMERVRRGGFESAAAAQRSRDELLALSQEEQAGRSWTVARWLRYWLSVRTGIRPTTRMHYTRDVERFLIPHLGTLILGDLTTRQLNAAFTQIALTRNRFGQPQTPCTLQHVRTTLRAALTVAVRDGLIRDNAARRVELPNPDRVPARVWTDARVAEWQSTGTRPVVAVWTPAQLAEFLHSVRHDGLYALWWLIALRGLRRGEAAGLRWAEIDLRARELSVVRQRTTAGYEVYEGSPKSAASRRTVALDKRTVAVLRQHAHRQRTHRETRIAASHVCHDSGYVFTGPDGMPLHPGYLTQRLRLLIDRARLPPIRLHDLRHGAATLARAAGADLKMVQDQLGHASMRFTADVYTAVLPDAQRKTAEATARLVMDAANTLTQRRERRGRGAKTLTELPPRNGRGGPARERAERRPPSRRRSSDRPDNAGPDRDGPSRRRRDQDETA